MSKQLVPSPSTYLALREEVLRTLQEGKERARQAVEREKVQTYWEVGRLLRTHLLAHKERANYREQVLARLAQDVEMSQRLLYQMLELNRAFPILHARAKLTWTHYRTLLSVQPRAEREFYEQEASEAGWSVRELGAQIRAGAFEKGAISAAEEAAPRPEIGPPLLPKRGWLYTYRVVESPAVNGEAGAPCLDLGFDLYYAPETDGTDSPASGRIVESLREKKGPGRYRFRVSRAGQERLYTYRAVVEEVIDGDTLWTRVDCGFRAWTRQKLRLRGIDAPEISTLAGRRTRDFVARALSEVPFVVLTTTKPDKYDRYLSDVFYLPGGTDPQEALDRGTFLNQQLLDNGLAVRFAG